MKTDLLTLYIMTTIIAGTSNPVPAQTYKMTTPIAPGVATPDTLETSIGQLNLTDGVPKPDTVEKIYDNLDRSRHCRPICWRFRS